MAKVFRVSTRFTLVHRETGAAHEFDKGDLIADPELLADLEGSEREASGHYAEVPDDHHAVLPFLPDEHPAIQEMLDRMVVPPEDFAGPHPKARRAASLDLGAVSERDA